MITEDYVSFETAKLLKEKGFNEDCHYAYHYYTHRPFYHRKMNDFNGGEYRGLKDEWYSAPTLQMAMKWLREVHHCVICVTPLTFYCGELVSKWGYCIWADDNTEVDEENSPRFETYEEACEAAIKYCLENLI